MLNESTSAKRRTYKHVGSSQGQSSKKNKDRYLVAIPSSVMHVNHPRGKTDFRIQVLGLEERDKNWKTRT